MNKISNLEIQRLERLEEFNANMKKYIYNNKCNRVKDMICKAFDNFNPTKDRFDHPNWEALSLGIEFLKENGWKVGAKHWKEDGIQIIVKSPNNEYYCSRYDYTKYITKYNFNLSSDKKNFTAKIAELINDTQDCNAIRDHIFAAYSNINPVKGKEHPCSDVIEAGAIFLRENGWKIGISESPDNGKQVTAIGPSGKKYYSNYKHK